MGQPGELFDQDLTGGLLRPIRPDEDEADRLADDRRHGRLGASPARARTGVDEAPPPSRPEQRRRPPEARERPEPPFARPPSPAPDGPSPGETGGARRGDVARPGSGHDWLERRTAPPSQRPATPAAKQPPAEPRPPAPQRASVPDQSASLGRASAVMATGTLLSRLTGFARVIVVLAVLGVSGVDDAYNYANAIPNIVYDLLLGGILSASLVPVFVEQLRNPDKDEGDRSISAILTTILLALAAITVVLVVAAPLVIRFYLSLKGGSAAAGDERAVGTSLLHLFAPQVFFLGAIVVSTALLNARRQFAAAAFSPVVNNLIAIGAVAATAAVAHSTDVSIFRHDTKAIAVLGIGTTLGYAVQLLVQVPAMFRTGVRFRPVLDLHHPAVRRVIGLSGWLLGVVVANQVSLNVILVFAGKNTGDATAYQNAYQFFQLPYALFVVSVASALTPDLAERWTSGDRLGFAKRMITGLRVTLAFLTPTAVGYALLAQPLITLAVEHGQVNRAGAHTLGATLIGFVIGLPGFSAFVLLMRGYQAMQDTKTMFKLYAIENGLSLLATWPLYQALGVQGLALAWSLPYTLVACVAAVGLHRRVGSLGGALTVRALWRIAVVSVAMGVVVALVRAVVGTGGSDVVLIGRLIVEVGAGIGVFALGAWALGIEEVDPVVRLARRLTGRLGRNR